MHSLISRWRRHSVNFDEHAVTLDSPPREKEAATFLANMGTLYRMGYILSPADFSQVLPIWQSELWPERKSTIEPTSAINFGESQHRLENLQFDSDFFIAKDSSDQIIGVLGGHPTINSCYRIRGLWVRPDFRGRGVARSLIAEFEQGPCKETRARILWSMPQQASLNFYIACGFKQVGDFFNRYEFGPHCFVRKDLATV